MGIAGSPPSVGAGPETTVADEDAVRLVREKSNEFDVFVAEMLSVPFLRRQRPLHTFAGLMAKDAGIVAAPIIWVQTC